METSLQMAQIFQMTTKVNRATKATLHELPDKLQLTVFGKKNEAVTIRMLDSSSKPRKFFDDGFVSALKFTIPSDRDSLCVDFAKPQQGEYTIEVTTQAGTTVLDYRSA